jgi:hypothetical protein
MANDPPSRAPILQPDKSADAAIAVPGACQIFLSASEEGTFSVPRHAANGSYALCRVFSSPEKSQTLSLKLMATSSIIIETATRRQGAIE